MMTFLQILWAQPKFLQINYTSAFLPVQQVFKKYPEKYMIQKYLQILFLFPKILHKIQVFLGRIL